jgi:hypothetical protein
MTAPNTRVQRTRSASLRSPLTRKSLGGRIVFAWLMSLGAAVLGIACATRGSLAVKVMDEAGNPMTGVAVVPGQQANVSLLIRIGSISDGAVIGGAHSGEPVSWLTFSACPGHPETAVVIQTSGPKEPPQ